MVMVQHLQPISNNSSSKTTYVPAILSSTRDVPVTCFIKEGLLIPISSHELVAKVLRPFFIQLSTVEDGYIATSPISDLYELEMSVPNAVRNYLYSLADELIWLQEKKDNLSAPLLQQLETIQSYISIV